MQLAEKKQAALKLLSECGSAVVALSGGVDSAVLLALALEALGSEKVLAVTGASPSLAATDLQAARRTARALGARHEVVATREIERSDYRANLGDRCFHCRAELFEALARLADERGLRRVAYGAITDDLGDVRPGMRAAERLGIVAPLLAAGLSKADVRALAADAGLAVADKPAGACLASRIPVGTEVTRGRLEQIERAETALRGLGFRQLRVRHHGEVARIELDRDEAPRMLEPGLRRRAVRAVRAAGYRFVALDLDGYRQGSVSADGSETEPAPGADGLQRIGPARDGGQ
jgi:uncharacterized protein